MSLAPPPSRWQADDNYGSSNNQNEESSALILDSDGLAAKVVQAETANDAWRHVRALVASDARPMDLYDSLTQSGQDSIDPMPTGWPSLLKSRTPIMSKMPAMVMQRYNACQTVCFCGVFPQISRAWASVDNALFLWRFDKWNDVPVEYNSEQQAVCAVGLVKPRPGIFAEAIQHLLIVCTTTEITLLGVCCTYGNSDDPLSELSILPLPDYTLSSDNVTICTVSSSPSGRIFLGGGNGHLFEILYNSSGGWRQKKCSKRDHSLGFTAYLPSFLPALWQTPSPIFEIAIDNERHILYTRSQNSTISVYDLGSDGKSQTIQHIVDLSDLLNATTSAQGGDIFKGRSTPDRKGATILHLGIIPKAESQKLHLVIVTLDGRRVYFTTDSQYSYSNVGSGEKRPNCLRAVLCRKAPSSPSIVSNRGGASSNRGLNLSIALYYQGSILMGESVQGGRSKLLVTTRDMSIPPLSTSTASNSSVSQMREAVGELENLIAGDCCAIRPLKDESGVMLPSSIFLSDELASQTVTSPSKFVLISTAGVLELERRRPVEILQQILEDRDSAKMEQFYKAFGAAEASSMCFLLITGNLASPSGAVIQQAKAALENPTLTGIPQMKLDSQSENIAPNTGFDMGQAVPVAEPEWSAAHKGLCLYLSRILHPIWEKSIASISQTSKAVHGALSNATLEAYETRLRSIQGFLKEYQQKRRHIARANRSLSAYGGVGSSGRSFMENTSSLPNGHSYPNKRPRTEEAVRYEDQRVSWLTGLVIRTAEACFLLSVLNDHHLPRLASKLEDSVREKLKELSLRELVCSSSGEGVAAQLISVLVTEHLTGTDGIAQDLSATLQGGCPSYFKEEDRIYYKASGYLQKAETALSTRDRNSYVSQALQLMMKVPLASDLGRVVPQLLYLHCFSGCVELPLRKAECLDPSNLASNPTTDGRAAREARYEGCYAHVMQVLKFLIDPSSQNQGSAAQVEHDASLTPEIRRKGLDLVLEKAVASNDDYFHKILYNTLFDLKAYKDLLSLDNSRLEKHLKTEAGVSSVGPERGLGPLSPSQVQNLELLAKLFIKRGDTLSASTAYEILGTRSSGSGDQSVNLEERQEAYQNAVLQARASGNPERASDLEARWKTIDIQQRLLNQLKSQLQSLEGDEKQNMQDTVEDLAASPKDLAELYNDFACPLQQWGLALEMVGLAKYNNPVYIKQLWDVYLRQAWDANGAQNQGSSAQVRRDMGLEACCTSVERLGSQLYPNEGVFPVWHVAARLETLAAGVWPENGPSCSEDNRVISALLKACNMNQTAVFRVYDSLVGNRVRDDSTEDLLSLAVKPRVFTSLLIICTSLAQQLQDKQPGFFYNQLPTGVRREANVLMEACQRYASKAGRLSNNEQASADLQREFNSIANRLHSALSQ